MNEHMEPASRPARLPIPSDLSTLSSEELGELIESWAYRGAPATFSQVIGHEAQVAALQRLARVLHLSAAEPERLEALGIRTGTAGAAICGPSSTGKTLLARALSSEAGYDRRIYVLPTAELTPALLTRVYAALSTMPASIVIIDEAERLIGAYSFEGAVDELRVAFLAAIDGMDRASAGGPMTVGLTTLEPNRIHDACLRPGRLSPILTLSLPSRADRRRMWTLELDRRPCGAVDPARLAELTEGGWSGAEIAGAVEEAAIEIAGTMRMGSPVCGSSSPPPPRRRTSSRLASSRSAWPPSSPSSTPGAHRHPSRCSPSRSHDFRTPAG